jgi:hypothetical protein
MPHKKLRRSAVFGFLLSAFVLTLCQCGYKLKDAEDVVSVPNAAHRLFVTSRLYNGNLGGVSGADAICNSDAEAVGLHETYRALLATSTATLMDRLGTDTRPVYTASTTDAIEVSSSLSFFISNLNIRYLEPFWFRYGANGHDIGAAEYWAGFDYDGVNGGLGSCVDWTDDSAIQAMIGSNYHRGLATDFCNTSRALVCVSL